MCGCRELTKDLSRKVWYVARLSASLGKSGVLKSKPPVRFRNAERLVLICLLKRVPDLWFLTVGVKNVGS